MGVNNATDRYESLLQLTPAQAIAADALYAGGTHQEAAQAAGVNRVTVSRWVHHHPAFIAEMTRRRYERYESLACRSEAVSERAIALVMGALDDGDLNAALAWLKMTTSIRRLRDLASPTQDAALTPAAVIAKAAEEASMREVIEVYTSTYRGAAVDRIHAELEA